MLGAALVAALGAAPAQAGQPCDTRPVSLYEMTRGLDLAGATARLLQAQSTEVAVIARVGQDLRDYDQHYSHIGFVYRQPAQGGQPGPWRVVHKLNECGSAAAHLYRQGLAEFFSDALFEWQAAVLPLGPDTAMKVQAVLNDPRRLARVHERQYNMLAYPWSTQYQQSNQWVLETLAMAMEPAIIARDQAQAWLRFKGYRPDRLSISAFTRLGARISRANVAFDDHPNALRFADQIDTVTADSALRWLVSAQLAQTSIIVK
ncbi:MAG: DUF2145 domain-containing protein [Burkholderiaceae bacterium]